MLQVAVLKQNTDWVKERLAVKHFDQLNLVDEILSLDEQRKKLQAAFDNTQSRINSASKEIGKLMAQGKTEEADQQKTSIAAWKQEIPDLAAQMSAIEKNLHDTLVLLPNLPYADVPTGRTPEDNVVVRTGGSIPQLDAATMLPHWDLVKKYGLIDFELGTKITGAGFPVYTGQGARLQRSLIQYFLDYNTAAGYKEIVPPFMVNEASAYGTGQLPDKEGQMYYVNEDNFYLIPTSEVPVTNMYRDTILKETELPLKLTAYSPCFRREAGSYGKDVRGLNRLHQFEKVEIIQLTEPGKSYEALEQMIRHVETLLNNLELPYRLLRLCGGDMSFASAITYDFEVYSTAQSRWLEVSSVTNFETFQTNRMKCRYKNAEGKMQLVHSLNGSSLALPRIVAALLENHQQPEGIRLPQVLQPYFGKNMIQ